MGQHEFKRFDMLQKPRRQKTVLTALAWLISIPDVISHQVRIKKNNTKGLKPPYLLLCNHNSFLDFKIATAAIFPAKANYVVAIDGFIKREWLLRQMGCICKRKFTNDLILVKHLHQVIKNGDIAVLYPEARYSLCGTPAVLPESLGKLAKFLKVPVVTLIIHGDHINSPFWNTKNRKIKKIQAGFTQILTSDEVQTLSPEEINRVISEHFQYDDYEWQKKHQIPVKDKKRCEGLHKVLYQCPNCNREYQMMSFEDHIFCNNCGKKWTMTEYGELQANTGEIEFSAIPDWYEWQRKQVREEIESGNYFFQAPVTVKSLPNTKGYITLGEGILIHDRDGFLLQGTYKNQPYEERWSGKSLYSCHIEYNYLNKYGDCVDLNTLTDTYYLYPHDCDFSVTKLALATEELYGYCKSEIFSQKDERKL